MHKDPAWCPQCKAPFSALLTHRKLDGSLSDFPVEESLCLLKRSTWFAQHLRVRFLMSRPHPTGAGSTIHGISWERESSL